MKKKILSISIVALLLCTGLVSIKIYGSKHRDNGSYIEDIPIAEGGIIDEELDKDSEDNNKEDDSINDISNDKEIDIDSSKVKKIHAQLEGDICWSHLCVTDDGYILGRCQPNSNNQQDMIFYNMDTEETNIIYTTEPRWTIGSAEINDNFILWDETIAEETGLRPCRVMIMDRKTKEVTKLFEDMDYTMYMPFIKLCLGDTSAYWSVGKKDNDNPICIMKYDTIEKEICDYKKMATSPLITEKYFYWTGPEDDKMENAAIYQEDLKSGEIKKITNNKSPNYIEGKGEDIIFTGLDRIPGKNDVDDMGYPINQWSICLYSNNEISKLKVSKKDIFEFPSFNGKYIGWRGTDKLRLYSIDENVTYILTRSAADYTEVTLSEKYALWNSPVKGTGSDAKHDAIERGMYDSYIYILKLDDIK